MDRKSTLCEMQDMRAICQDLVWGRIAVEEAEIKLSLCEPDQPGLISIQHRLIDLVTSGYPELAYQLIDNVIDLFLVCPVALSF